MSKRGRPRKAGQRNAAGRLIGNVEPCERVLERRALYAWIVPSKGPDGRVGTIDQDICDGVGQLHALGLLDGYQLEPQDLRDKGREWRDHYVSLLKRSGFKTGSYERMAKATSEVLDYTRRDERFDTVDNLLKGRPRTALLQMLVDPMVGSYPDERENVYWVESLIAEALMKRRIMPPRWMQPVFMPTPEIYQTMKEAIEGLVILAGDQRARLAA